MTDRLYHGYLYRVIRVYIASKKIPGLQTDVFPDFDGQARSNAYQQIVLTCTHTGTKSLSDNAETNL